MKRDLDLARQLLFDIEANGANCALSTLRAGATELADECVRYHLRLLIDAQFVKEIERTNSGVPCVRLTNSGHELLELARSDARWHDACRCVAETSGGESLTVIRALLVKWAIESASQADRPAYRRYRPVYHRIERPRRFGYLADRELADEPRAQVVRARPEHRVRRDYADYRNEYRGGFRERFDWRDAYDYDVYGPRGVEPADYERTLDETAVGVSLPVYMV
ncbi:hypothetical protein Pla123a_37660 [Posidoniimonas polymericola]|uniref:Uncharacterized protein n=1 Tax=Posidoniimonas polymericola TaxID=2528002 RepID=A0A5C5YG18_9BACT|nr:DUF2513 domain-containing protein [Posidoniimonas polymericola]TWT73431.1 hypothetical protein Pla123a_37660 [Posidoniimonas polymericola]